MRRRWRAPVVGAAASFAVASALAGPAELASGGPQTAAPKKASVGRVVGASGGPFTAAVARLRQDGTIDAAQAAAVDAAIRSGSVDAGQLVRAGVLTDAQVRTVDATWWPCADGGRRARVGRGV